MKSILSIGMLFMLLVLFGCEKNNLELGQVVTSIEVYKWDNEELVTTISDDEFIDELIHKLNHADSITTANLDFMLPDYVIYLKHDEETLYELGYYMRTLKLSGIDGKYLDFEADLFYDVDLALPIE
ncbi:hypothetical protein [Alkalibacillus aidingensis]|uniref:hypothetical protein n=1 Tax=Alkalibacillus aidingensis TaxID=2747607 RepID=UPI001660FB5F|nr:hypothetical protein [Alkalibacillus aidingensis]